MYFPQLKHNFAEKKNMQLCRNINRIWRIFVPNAADMFVYLRLKKKKLETKHVWLNIPRSAIYQQSTVIQL
jgi:hypothetical protein